MVALLGVVLGVLITILTTKIFEPKREFDGDYNRWRKLNLILQEVQKNYVDTIDMKGMTDPGKTGSSFCLSSTCRADRVRK